MFASGVSGQVDEDVYLPPMGWKTDDFLYFNREVSDATILYRTDGSTLTRAGIQGVGEADYRFLREFQGDSILVGSGSEGDFLVRENALSSTKIEMPLGLNMNTTPPINLGERFGFTGSFGAGQRLFFTDGESLEMIDFNLGWRGVQSPMVAGSSLFFKGQSDDVSPYTIIFHFDGETIKPLDLGYDDYSGTRIIAADGDDVIIVGRGKVQRTNGETTTTIAENVLTNGGGAWLAAQTETETLLLMDTSTGEPFSRQRGLYRIVDDQAVLVDIGSTADGGYSVNNRFISVMNEAIYFTAFGGNGDELFRLVGDELTEFDINPDGHSNPENFRVFDDRLFFSATGPNGREAYVLDGDELSLVDINPNGDSDPWFMDDVNGKIVVLALTGNGLSHGASSSDRELIAIYAVPEPSAITCVVLFIGTYMVFLPVFHRNKAKGRSDRQR